MTIIVTFILIFDSYRCHLKSDIAFNRQNTCQTLGCKDYTWQDNTIFRFNFNTPRLHRGQSNNQSINQNVSKTNFSITG